MAYLYDNVVCLSVCLSVKLYIVSTLRVGAALRAKSRHIAVYRPRVAVLPKIHIFRHVSP